MKILKSGIEVNSKELSTLKGGACSCGCDIGFNGEHVNSVCHENHDGACYCECSGDIEAQHDMGNSANKQLFLPIS